MPALLGFGWWAVVPARLRWWIPVVQFKSQMVGVLVCGDAALCEVVSPAASIHEDATYGACVEGGGETSERV